MAQLARIVVAGASVLVALSAPTHAAQRQPQCTPAGTLVQLPGLAEASGLTASRRVAGRLWAHNDSGKPVLFALDAAGAVTGQVAIMGATVEDWEAIAAAPCGAGSCLYIGDIGDNGAERPRITVYELPEPERASGTMSVSNVYHATYPDRPQDAEALVVGPDGRLYVVTKGETGPIAIYRFPARRQSGATVQLERVAAAPSNAEGELRITDASVSQDRQWVVLRSSSALMFYRASELLKGQWRVAFRVDLRTLKEPQGEGVAISGDAVFLAGEGGGTSRAGSFVRFSCTPGE